MLERGQQLYFQVCQVAPYTRADPPRFFLRILSSAQIELVHVISANGNLYRDVCQSLTVTKVIQAPSR